MIKVEHQPLGGDTAAPVVRGRDCPLCGTPAGEPCQPKPPADHLARHLDAFTAGQLTRQYMRMVLAELVVIDASAVITSSVTGPERGPLTVSCPSCGAPEGEPCTGSWACVAREYAAAEAKQAACHYCERTGQRLKPCCDRPEHEHQLACADVEDCRDYLLGELKEQNARFDAAVTRLESTLKQPEVADRIVIDLRTNPPMALVGPMTRADCEAWIRANPEEGSPVDLAIVRQSTITEPTISAELAARRTAAAAELADFRRAADAYLDDDTHSVPRPDYSMWAFRLAEKLAWLLAGDAAGTNTRDGAQ